MEQTVVDKQVRSFVSFALAMKPSVTLQRHCAGEALSDTSVEFKLDGKGTLSQSKLSSLEALLKKYEPIKKYLHIGTSPEDAAGFNILTCAPMVTFQPDVDYHMIKVNSNQLAVAKQVARLVKHTHDLHTAGDRAGASAAYDELQTFLGRQREELIGDFRNVSQITDAVGMHGVGRGGNPRADGDCGGAVIFVIIEIFIA